MYANQVLTTSMETPLATRQWHIWHLEQHATILSAPCAHMPMRKSWFEHDDIAAEHPESQFWLVEARGNHMEERESILGRFFLYSCFQFNLHSILKAIRNYSSLLSSVTEHSQHSMCTKRGEVRRITITVIKTVGPWLTTFPENAIEFCCNKYCHVAVLLGSDRRSIKYVIYMLQGVWPPIQWQRFRPILSISNFSILNSEESDSFFNEVVNKIKSLIDGWISA